MDPVTQGLFGALWAGSSARAQSVRRALTTGAVAGMAPDLDSLVQSASDPLLELEFHRQFTHALLFVPVGALLVALVLWPWLRRDEKFARVYLWAFLGYLSHGFLDCFTSYGTSWFWPVSDVRLAWDWMPIIDPLFSLPLALGLSLAWWCRRSMFAMIGLVYAAAYLLFGGWQHSRAQMIQTGLIEDRGVLVSRQRVMPSIGNLLVWRSVYRQDDEWVVDALRTSPFSADQLWPGTTRPVFQHEPENPQLREAVERYRHFTQDYLARGPDTVDGKTVVSDIRYSNLPQSTEPLWALVLGEDGEIRDATHLQQGDRPVSEFWTMIKGDPCEYPDCQEL